MNLTIRQRIIIWVVVLVALSSVIKIVFIAQIGSRAAAGNYIEALSDYVVQAESTVFHWREAVREDVEMVIALCSESDKPLTDSGLIDDWRWKINTTVENREFISVISVIDAVTGEVILSTEPKEEGKIRGKYIGYPKHDQTIYLSEIRRPALEDQSYIEAVGPIFIDGTIKALVEMHFDSSSVVATLALQRHGLTGETYAVDRFGYVLSSLRKVTGLADSRRLRTEGILNCLKGNDGNGKFVDYNGDDVYGSYKWSEDTQMCILSKINVTEVNEGLSQMALAIIVIGLIVAMLIGLVTYLVVGSLTSGLDVLRNIAERFSAGDYSVRAENIKSNDEIGKVAKVFNHMAESVSNSQKDLSRQVNERTKELKKSESLYRTLIESTSDIIFDSDLNGRITFISSQITKYGYVPSEMIGHPFTDYLREDCRERLMNEVIKVVKSGKQISVDLIGIGADGTEYEFELISNPKVDENGQVVGIISQARDVTSSKEAERDARRKSKLARQYLNVSAAVIVAYDLDGIVTNINDHGAEEIGKSQEEIIGRSVSEFLSKQSQRGLLNVIIEAKQNEDGPLNDEESVLITIKGNRWYSWTNSRLLNDEGVTTGIVSSGIDVTESKKAQEEIKNERETFKRIFDASNDALVIFSGLKFLSVNEAAVKIFGYKNSEELIEGSLPAVCPPNQPNGRPSLEFAAEQVEIARQEGKNFFEWAYVRPDGTSFLATVLLTHLMLGDADAMQATVRDVTAERAAEEKVQSLDRLKSRFITGLTHIIRTPLNRIRWMLEGLESGDFDDQEEAGRTLMHQAFDSIDEILQAVHNMNIALDIERGSLTLEKMPTSLVGLVLSVRGRYIGLPDIKKIEWIERVPENDMCMVNVDVESVRSVVTALMDNAIRYLEKEHSQITISVSRQNNHVRCEITDNGVGIPDAEKVYIFERFYRASNAQLRYTDGMGLGLHIAKSLIQAHGGEMGFESKENQGSTFWFTLPSA